VDNLGGKAILQGRNTKGGFLENSSSENTNSYSCPQPAVQGSSAKRGRKRAHVAGQVGRKADCVSLISRRNLEMAAVRHIASVPSTRGVEGGGGEKVSILSPRGGQRGITKWSFIGAKKGGKRIQIRACSGGGGEGGGWKVDNIKPFRC